jgi:hypothetical protein
MWNGMRKTNVGVRKLWTVAIGNFYFWMMAASVVEMIALIDKSIVGGWMTVASIIEMVTLTIDNIIGGSRQLV